MSLFNLNICLFKFTNDTVPNDNKDEFTYYAANRISSFDYMAVPCSSAGLLNLCKTVCILNKRSVDKSKNISVSRLKEKLYLESSAKLF